VGAIAERHYPWAAGLVVAGLCGWWMRAGSIPPGTKDLLAAILNVAAILAGFLMTAKSILLSMDDKWIIRRSKEAGAYEMLVGYMVSATYWWLACAVLSAVGLAIVPPGDLQDWQKPPAVALFCGWVFVSATSAFASLRVLSIYSIILRSISRS
jgi:hypothetical protein